MVFKPVPGRVNRSSVVENVFQDNIWRSKVVLCGLPVFWCTCPALASESIATHFLSLVELYHHARWDRSIRLEGWTASQEGSQLQMSAGHETHECVTT